MESRVLGDVAGPVGVLGQVEREFEGVGRHLALRGVYNALVVHAEWAETES